MKETVKSAAWAGGAGALFGVGLVVSRMVDPRKVLGFLDLFGAWDASLAFVMLGAIAVHAVGRRVVLGATRPWFDARFHVPARLGVDAPLVAGALTFGVGWGLSGFCPGPALVAAAAGLPSALVFVPTMLVGMWLHDRLRPPAP